MQLGDPLRLSSYFSNLLYYKSFSPDVFNYQNAWMTAWKRMQDGSWFGPSQPTNDPDGLFHTLVKNRQSVSAIINLSTDNGDGTYTLQFFDATYNVFRVGHNVTDSNMNDGYILDAAPGQIRIKPLYNPTAFTGAEFQANMTVKGLGKLGGLRNSTGTTSIYENKDVQTDYLEFTRESQQIARTDKAIRWAATVGGEKKVYGYYEAEADMVNRGIFYSVYKKFFGGGGNGVVGLEGTTPKTYGIRNRLIDDSGNYINGNAAVTQNQLEQIVGACADANPGFEQRINLFPGRQFLKQIATFYPTQLGYSGGRREADGKISISSDVRQIIVAGITVDVHTDFAMLNDTENLPPWMQHSGYFINTGMTMVAGEMRSLIHPIHFSQTMSSDYRPTYRCVPGMIGVSEGDSTGLPNQGMYQLAGSSVDGAGCEFLDFSGISMIPYGHGLFEWIH